MSELAPAYVTTHSNGTRPAVIVAESPLDPRTRALVVGIRAALLLLCDVLGAYAGLAKRE